MGIINEYIKTECEKMKAKSLIDKRKVMTSGHHKCSNCGKNHCPGVGHKKCGRGAIWYWIDSQTKYCICVPVNV